MFIGKQIAIQKGLNNFNQKIPKSKEKAGYYEGVRGINIMDITLRC